MPKTKYFAKEEAKDLVNYVSKKATDYYKVLATSDYFSKVRKSWRYYNGAFYGSGHEITYGGEQGELVNLPVNHYQNFAKITKQMVTGTRPSFKARSINTDHASQVQTGLAEGLLEYYLRELKIEQSLNLAVEHAIVLGTGYIKMDWDPSAGEIHDYILPENVMEIDPETGEEVEAMDEDGNPIQVDPEEEPMPIYKGDIRCKNLSTFDVIYDTSKDTFEDVDWVLVRTWKNKFSLAAEYPEMREKIVSLETRDEIEGRYLFTDGVDESTDIPVYEFFHKKIPAIPEGRHVIYLEQEVVLEDTDLLYPRIPIYRIVPGTILGTPQGSTPMFDLIPLQDAFNSLTSTIMTNQNAFGVQNIASPFGSNVRVSELMSGMNHIEYEPIPNAPGGGLPTPLNLTQTPGEIFNFLTMIQGMMETISGISATVRGNPEASLKSGAALALVQSQALQYFSGLQQSYISLMEDVGTGLIELLQQFADVPRIVHITGTGNVAKAREFKADQINSVKRVVVDVGNPLSQTTAGRAQMAEQLLQMGAINNPQQYFSVLNTGNLDVLTDGVTDSNELIKKENEELTEGTIKIEAWAGDPHAQHIREHSRVIADPHRRKDVELVTRVNAHIKDHLDLSRTVDPDLLAIIGEQPLGPPAGSPVAPGSGAPQGGAPDLSAGLQPAQGMPNANMPQVPASPSGQPVSPEEAMAAQTGA